MSSLVSTAAVAVLRAAEESHGEPAVPAWVVGLIALGILMAMLGGLVAFGRGREHS
jgi:hypothetical protein